MTADVYTLVPSCHTYPTPPPPPRPSQSPYITLGHPTIVVVPEYKEASQAPKLHGISLFTCHVRRGAADVQDPMWNSHSKLNCIAACIQVWTLPGCVGGTGARGVHHAPLLDDGLRQRWRFSMDGPPPRRFCRPLPACLLYTALPGWKRHSRPPTAVYVSLLARPALRCRRRWPE